MNLFLGESRYPDLSKGYELYLHRSAKTPKERILSLQQYNRIVKSYCKALADKLEDEGITDLPSNIGSIAAVNIRKKPTYDKTRKAYRPADLIDWDKTRETGGIVRKDCRITFGFVFVPKRIKGHENFRCFGIRANKALYKRMKKHYDAGTFNFYLADLETYLV